MLIVLMLAAVGVGAYWIGARHGSSRNQGDGRASANTSTTHTPHLGGPELIAIALGAAVLLAVLIGGPALFGPIGGPGLLGP